MILRKYEVHDMHVGRSYDYLARSPKPDGGAFDYK